MTYVVLSKSCRRIAAAPAPLVLGRDDDIYRGIPSLAAPRSLSMAAPGYAMASEPAA